MKVFTYGSLMRGFRNHTVMQRANGQFIKEAVIDGLQLRAYCQGFPCAVQLKGYAVSGEVYEVDDVGLMALDRLESEGSFYHRIKATTEEGDQVDVYILKPDDALGEVIPSGSWRTYKRNQKSPWDYPLRRGSFTYDDYLEWWDKK